MTRCTCFVDGCSNTSYENTLKFFRLPTDPVTAIRWLKLIGRAGAKLTNNYYVCEEHFSDDCFYSKSSKSIKKLPKDALPCVKLPPTSVDTGLMLHKSTQCKPPHLPQNLSMKTNKKQETSKGIAPSQNPKDVFNKLCNKFLGPEIAQIVKAQADVKSKFSENKNDFDFTLFCLKCYYTSPASYFALQTSLSLPDKKTLARKLMLSIASDHNKLYSMLRAKVACMSDLEKQCYILIGFVNIKPHLFFHIRDDKIYGFSETNGFQEAVPSNSAVVLFARGIYEPWTLVVDYALFPKTDSVTHSELISSWFHETIKELLSTGLKIRICISNLSPNIIASSTEPENVPMNIEKPFIFVDKKQIYYTIDPKYLIKKIHNCFMECEFHFRDTIAKWQDVVDFYNRDSKKKLRLAPKLSEEHVRCSNNNEKPFSLIMNTLSKTVSAGISAYIEFGVMDAAALGTVRFLTIMSNLIDFTHSCNAPHHRELKKPFEGSEEQINDVIEALTYFRNLKLYKNNVEITESVDWITDFQIAIKSLLMLSEDFKLENYPNFFTRNLNFNVMSNFFHFVSKKNHKPGVLLPWKLITEFHRRFFRSILQTPKYRYCPEVINGIFFDYLNSKSVIDERFKTIKKSQTKFKAGWLSLPVTMSDYKDFSLPIKDQMEAIGVFLLNKTLEKHTSCTLPNLQKVVDYMDNDSPIDRFPEYKLEKATKTVIPDKYFMLFIWELEKELESYFKTSFWKSNFMLKLESRSNATGESFNTPCPCFPVIYLKKLFFRLRLAQILKMNNRTYKRNPQSPSFCYKCPS